MSSEYNNERLETLQKNYRSAWISYAAAVECLQSTQQNGDSEQMVASARERVETAAKNYRITRDEMALFLLDQAAHHTEFVAEIERTPEFAGSLRA